MESASQKDVTDLMSFQLHVDIDIKYISSRFQLIEIMINESTCITVKDLLYIIHRNYI